MLETIKQNIENYGFHVYHIGRGTCPGFSYTIGLLNSAGAEVVFAGGAYFEGSSVGEIINGVAEQLLWHSRQGAQGLDLSNHILSVGDLGVFTLRRVDESWAKLMLLGATDYFHVPTYQIVPEKPKQTIDIPDLRKPRSYNADPIWTWLDASWTFDVPSHALAMVNLLALRGARISEAVRWEDGWHLYASQETEVTNDDLRIVPIGVPLGSDFSLEPVLELRVGEALWRDSSGGEWQKWDFDEE